MSRSKLQAIAMLASSCCAVIGCDQHQLSKHEEPAETVPPTDGRAETKNLRAADAVGYDGKQLKRTLDRALDANDQHNEQLEDAEKTADDQ